jgi:beta-phosphoglucomutase-like phosphatase (HAD superfamily)
MTPAGASRPPPERPRAVEAVVFDMDGVIADTEPAHVLSWEALFAERGLAAPGGYFDRFVGVCDTDSVPVINRDFGLQLEADETIARRLDLFAEIVTARGLRANDGFPELLRRCRAARLPVAVATGSWRRTARVILDAVAAGMGAGPNGAGLFDAVIARDDVSRPKPDPETYATACARLARAPRRCLAVEDSPSGIASAVGAGLHCIALSTRYFPPAALAHAHQVIGSLREVRWE